MKNYVQPGQMITIVAAAAIASGDVVEIGDFEAGVASKAAAIGESVECSLAGVFSLAKAGATVLAIGASVDWNATTKLVVAGGTGDFKLGKVFEAAGNGPTSVKILLNGIPASGM